MASGRSAEEQAAHRLAIEEQVKRCQPSWAYQPHMCYYNLQVMLCPVLAVSGHSNCKMLIIHRLSEALRSARGDISLAPRLHKTSVDVLAARHNSQSQSFNLGQQYKKVWAAHTAAFTY